MARRKKQRQGRRWLRICQVLRQEEITPQGREGTLAYHNFIRTCSQKKFKDEMIKQ